MTTPVITPPPNARSRRRRRIRRITSGVLVVVALAAGGWAGASQLRERAADAAALKETRARYCPALTATAGDGFELSRKDPGGPCTGWIVEQDYPFGSTDPDVNAVISRIVAENRRVRDQPKPYTRVGVLMPMTHAAGSALSRTEIRHALQGAYTAQVQANRPASAELGDPTPLVQLVLANEGPDQNGWPDVVAALGRLTGGPHPLVAVTGLGISVPATRLAAEALSALEIPAIGAVVTADDMVAPWLFKVSPSNHQYALALQAYLAQRPRSAPRTWSTTATRPTTTRRVCGPPSSTRSATRTGWPSTAAASTAANRRYPARRCCSRRSCATSVR